jgi:DNA-binding transcriptional LysR family regulator
LAHRLVDLSHLRTFVTVARERNLTRAAEHLAMSQPAASAHIRAIEEQFEVRLFERTSRGLELTPVGRTLLTRAEHLLTLALEFTSATRELREGISGPVYIGSNADPLLSRMGEFVADLKSQLPLIEPHIQLQSAHATRESIRNGELDFGFLLGTPVDDNLGYRRLLRVVYRVVGPRQWQDKIVDADRAGLAKMPWIITPPGNAHTDMMRELFLDYGLQPKVVAEANNDLLIRSLINEGIGLSLIREDYAIKADSERTMSLAPSIAAETSLLFAHAVARKEERVMKVALAVINSMWSTSLQTAL